MNKLIHLRQAIAYLILFMVLVFSLLFRIPQNYLVVITSCFIVLSGIVFIPSIKKEIGYPDWLQTVLYYLPLYIWGVSVFFYAPNKFVEPSYRLCLVVVVLSVVLTLTRYKDFERVLKSPISRTPITYRSFFLLFSEQIVALLSEEIYFTYFIMTEVQTAGMPLSVLISSVLFLAAHLFNRWAQKMFAVKDYFYILSLGIMKALSYWYSSVLLLPILIHFFYNGVEFYVLFKRLFIRKDTCNVFFDDY